MATRSIALDPQETAFVQLLDAFATAQNPPVECRIAGGWVRDKILALPSADLDIALSISSGYAFAASFVDFLHTKGVSTGSVGKVVANPEQSKHLETGCTRIMGLECDFVGLRSEKYTDSRIPQVEPGTPYEDASRRDLTINALFYNVHTRQIEDWTEKGLVDLENQIARTPLAPRQTFQDDPLRIVRCVRFASRFNLHIAEDAFECIKEDDVKLGIIDKVSKERIGIEMTKMIHKNPYRALELIHQLGLHPYVFHCDVNPPRHEAFAAAQILNALSDRKQLDEMLWLATAATPFRHLDVRRKGKSVPATAIVIGEGLKLSTEIKSSVSNLFDAVKVIDPGATRRSDIGAVLQLPSVRPWRRSLVWAVVMEVLPQWRGDWDEAAEDVYQKYEDFEARIESLGLPAAIDQPLLLNGNDVQSLLSISPGPLITVIRQSLNLWQLDHPEATRDQAEEWLKSQWEGQQRVEWEKLAPPRVMNKKTKKAEPGEKRKR
ncbi:hypothetical protein I350_00394 [Cryptococcus amylolentus CBS 6273]|uniref:Poly A polymerase head domain-containing protein n=1 Tax=Cryptococcus amylolentus CBS 6273 TaxID=1296118 RepID=A0A1E3KH27_9TREE|nr:hypothetical protein I350_00394 [Cryptococcus amylolentus CBS 6273]